MTPVPPSARRPAVARPAPAALLTAASALTVLAAACAPALAVGAFGDPATAAGPPVQAAPAAWQGVWAGGYTTPTFHRRGRFTLTLFSKVRAAPAEPGAAHTAGERAAGMLVFLLSEVRSGPGDAAAGPAAVRVPLRAAAVRAGELSARSEPYWDGDCGCTVVLTLIARQVGDSLTGTFSAHAAATAAAEPRGRWWAVRSGPTPATGAAERAP